MLDHFIKYYQQPDWWAYLFFLGPILISVIFFLKDKNTKLWKRLGVSAHGSILFFVLILSWMATELGWVDNGWALFLGTMPFALILVLIFSFFNFTGDKRLHYLHFFTLLSGFQIASISDWIAWRVSMEGKQRFIYEGHPWYYFLDTESFYFAVPALLLVFLILRRGFKKLKVK